MGLKESIYHKAKETNYYKMAPYHHAEVKKIWEIIEKNPSIYGTGFFIRLLN